MHFLLRYHYVPDIAERRGPHRDAHLARLWAEADAGRVIVAGAAGDPAVEAVILWSIDDPAVVAEFADGDPYMTAGLITSYEVVPYNSVVGEIAANPVRPA